jgi:hypothetical protein
MQQGKTLSLWVLLLVLGTWTFAVLQQPVPGYCAAQRRVLSDRELMLTVLNVQISSGRIDLSPWQTAHDYLANKPACCRVQRAQQRSTSDLLFGWANNAKRAEIFVTLAQKNSLLSPEGFMTVSFDLDSCGKVIKVESMDRDTLARE